MKPILFLLVIFAAMCACRAQRTADTLIYQNKKLLITQGDTANSSRMEIRNNKAVFTDRDGNPIDTNLYVSALMEYTSRSSDFIGVLVSAKAKPCYLIDRALSEGGKKVYFSRLRYRDPALQADIPIADFTITKIQ